MRAVPDNLFGIAKKDLLIEMLDSLSDSISTKLEPDIILEKIASMSCKAAVKGNSRLSGREVDALIGGTFRAGQPISLSAWKTDNHRDDKTRAGEKV